MAEEAGTLLGGGCVDGEAAVACASASAQDNVGLPSRDANSKLNSVIFCIYPWRSFSAAAAAAAAAASRACSCDCNDSSCSSRAATSPFISLIDSAARCISAESSAAKAMYLRGDAA
jgi:hypothetical protein